jgi:radical SAM protein with 4Fe4S-binding SPASM domain
MPDYQSGWNPLEKAKSSPTFCILPWIHQYVGTGGDVKPCCIYNPDSELGNLKKHSLKEIHNNNETRQLRLDMLNGVSRKECDECNLRDNLTNQTYKNNSNKRYMFDDSHIGSEVHNLLSSTLPDGTVPDHRLYYMDVRFNNLCNFKCVTCSPIFSTSLIADWQKMSGGDSRHGYRYAGKTEDDAFLQMLPHIPHLTDIYFAGGEPMMQREHYEFLQACIDQNTFPNLTYSTNLSRLSLGKYDVIELWKHFPHVTILASLDGCHQRAEYWRKETVWQDIESNRKRIAEYAPRVEFYINATVSWPNIYSVLELHQDWVLSGLLNMHQMNLNPIYSPDYLSLARLPNWKKIQVCDAISKHINWINSVDNVSDTHKDQAVSKFSMLIDFVNQDYPLIDSGEFFKIIGGLDSLRNGPGFFEVFTEHADMHKWLSSQL